ncbi:MAG: hypothetical protein GXP42_08295 [Chloroflexi bacterium]|nr:hypothetical protein [Chloroflexota bacterium]
MSKSLRNRRLSRFWVGLGIVFIVAVFFRFWQIDALPPGLFGDEAADGLDALDVLAGRGQVFFPTNFGREGLHMWIVALSILFLDATPLAVRLPSAIAGVVTVLATYWLGYEMFVWRKGENVPGDGGWTRLIPWLAGLYVATSYWHVHFSRFGIRGVFTPMCLALMAAALWRAINRQSLVWWAVSGFFLGLGMHFYTASRFAPIFLITFFTWQLLLYALARRKREDIGKHLAERASFPGLVVSSSTFWRFLLGVFVQFGVAALVFAPLGYYFLTHPGSFTQRASEVSVFREGGSSDALKLIARAASANLLQFIWPGRGDLAQFYNLPGRAVFEPLTALLGLVGLGVSLWRWRRPVYAFLVIWFAVMASPSFIAVDRFPTLPRVLGVIPALYFFPAIGLSFLLGWAARRRGFASRWWPAAALLALVVHASLTYRDYFHVWGPSEATAEAFEADMVAAWRWLEAHPPQGEVYLSSDLYKHPTFMFLYEQVPTTEYFDYRNPRLHWFDARTSWPLPNRDAVILVGDSTPMPDFLAPLLDLRVKPVEGGSLFVVEEPPKLIIANSASAGAPFTDRLSLLGQFGQRLASSPDRVVTLQLWRASGPEPVRWKRYQIQSGLLDDEGVQLVQASQWMGFLPMEWPREEAFLTWQFLPWPGELPLNDSVLRLTPEGEPPLRPPGSDEEGWLTWPLAPLNNQP